MSVTATRATNPPQNGIQAEQKMFRVFGTLVFAGSYSTGGEALSFASIGVPNTKPVDVMIRSLNGYSYRFNGATGTVRINTAANTELAAAAYPAGITGDTVVFEATFPKV